MTLKEAMAYRGENADTLAEKIGIRAGEITKWMRPAGLQPCRRCGSGAVRERRQRMSKDKCRMSRKRFCKKAAGKQEGSAV